MQTVFFTLVICALVFKSQGKNLSTFFLVINPKICHVYRQFTKNDYKKIPKLVYIYIHELCQKILTYCDFHGNAVDWVTLASTYY